MSEPQPGMGGAQVYSAAGRGLGGTSNVYHMIHTRGRPPTTTAGRPGRRTAGRTRTCCRTCSGWRASGTTPTRPPAGPARSPWSTRGTPAARSRRRSSTPASSSGTPGWTTSTPPTSAPAGTTSTSTPSAASAAASHAGYLAPALGRPNLATEVGALVTELVFDGDRCVGARYLQDGQLRTVRARHEVVLSARCHPVAEGADALRHRRARRSCARHGIDVRVELPGVGENFHDHPLIIGPIGYLDRPGPDPRGQVTEVAPVRRRPEPGLAVPDLEICLVHRAPFGEKFFANVIKRVQTGQPVAPVAELVDPHVVLSLPGLVRPSRAAGSGSPAPTRPRTRGSSRELLRRAGRPGADHDDGRDRPRHLPRRRRSPPRGASPRSRPARR